MSVHSKMTAIADALRSKTGGTSPLTLDQMATAIAGIQTGGGGTNGIYMAEVTLAANSGWVPIDHNLGTTDILLACMWAETLGDIVPESGLCLGSFWTKTDIPNRRTSTGGNQTCANWDGTNGYLNFTYPSSGTYWTAMYNENRVIFKGGGSAAAKYVAGVTYTVLIVAASAFSVTEV